MKSNRSNFSAATGGLTVALLLAAGCGRAPEPADLVLTGGTIITVDQARPRAQALAVRGDRIEAVGSRRAIARYIGPQTEVIDLEGAVAIPGFIEGHGHYMGLGRALMILDLTQAQSWEEIVRMVADAARTTPAGTWIQGRGWHQEKWDSVPEPSVDGVPVHADLSRASPRHPVYLTHASGHASLVNERALQLAGITRGTPDPPGGEIIKDARGEPTGLLRETAQRLVNRVIAHAEAQRSSAEIEAEMRQQVALAGQEALRKGVTSFHDAGASFETIDFFKQLAEEGQLPVRLYVMVRGHSNAEMDRRLPDYKIIGVGNNFLTVRSIKRQIDGALGAHGAWLLEPYDDLETTDGLVLEPVEDIRGTAEVAIRHGFQVNTHAIGDRANREVLDIYEEAFGAHPDHSDLRWRIEHAQHIHPDDLPRFAQLGVIAAMQGIHCVSDGPWIPRRLGTERTRRTSYLFRSLIDSGAIVGNGTDVPVEDIDPIASIYGSFARVMVNGERFYPEEAMTREEALRSYTVMNAYAAFEEDLKGMLRPGLLADITVLDRDLLTVPEDQIPDTRVLYTIVGGQVRYRR